MSDYYLIDRAGITSDHITARRAGELYAEAQGTEFESGLYGDLDTGFCYWVVDGESGLRLIRYHVTPVCTGEVPDDVCDHRCHIADA